MRAYPCRCTKCRTRQTLKRQPTDYYPHRVCVICGSDLKVDWYRRNQEHKRVLCRCYGYHYPHRKAGGVWCEHHPTGPTEEDYIQRYGHSGG